MSKFYPHIGKRKFSWRRCFNILTIVIGLLVVSYWSRTACAGIEYFRNDKEVITMKITGEIDQKTVDEAVSGLRSGAVNGLEIIWGGLISPEMVLKILEVIPGNTTLTSLKIIYGKIGAEVAQVIAKILKGNTTLTSLDLRGNRIGDDGVRLISKALEGNKTLTSLGLGGNHISDDGVRSIFEGNTQLTSLDLRDNQISDDSVPLIFEALEGNTKLTSLDLRGNQISDDGVHLIRETLKENITLTRLGLEVFDVETMQTVQFILDRNKLIAELGNLKLKTVLAGTFPHIGSDSPLSLLGISDIPFQEIVKFYKEAISKNDFNIVLHGSKEDLEKLPIVFAPIDYEIINEIRMLQNRITPDQPVLLLLPMAKVSSSPAAKSTSSVFAASDIIDSESEQGPVVVLKEYNSTIGDESARAIAGALRQNTLATFLDLGGSNIDAAGVRTITAALRTSPILTSINLARIRSGHDIGAVGYGIGARPSQSTEGVAAASTAPSSPPVGSQASALNSVSVVNTQVAQPENTTAASGTAAMLTEAPQLPDDMSEKHNLPPHSL